MRFLIRHDITGETFTVKGSTRKECRTRADTECAQRGWNIEQVGSERIEKKSLKLKLAIREKETKWNARIMPQR